MENLRDEILRLNLKSIIQTKEKLKDHIIETPTIKFNSSFLKTSVCLNVFFFEFLIF